jgi:hypothetical protein
MECRTPLGNQLVREADLGRDVLESLEQPLEYGFTLLQDQPLILDKREEDVTWANPHLAPDLRWNNQTTLWTYGNGGAWVLIHGSFIMPQAFLLCHWLRLWHPRRSPGFAGDAHRSGRHSC